MEDLVLGSSSPRRQSVTLPRTRSSISPLLRQAVATMLSHSSKTMGKTPANQLIIAYGLALIGIGAVWHLIAEGQFSSILTVSVMVQCLATVLLSLQVLSKGSAAGISARSLSLDILALCCRLSSTIWLNGYLPVDASGDYIFQAVDVLSLGILVWLLHQVLVVSRHSYQEAEDSLPCLPMVAIAFILAMLLHGNMNSRPLFDALWMAGLFVSTIAVLPQLWLVTQTGGQVEALTSHHIAAMAVSRALSGVFMWHARGDISCVPWFSDFNHAIWAILGSHLVHLLLLGDFGYYYFKAVMAQGLACQIDINNDGCGV
mmetsp:Transcript_131867/g.239777  ORF Transcript_131867/g.239777 Transcript_131867/m.239777 type:complete len:316 (+) Transcript_131867:3-950(+)